LNNLIKTDNHNMRKKKTITCKPVVQKYRQEQKDAHIAEK